MTDLVPDHAYRSYGYRIHGGLTVREVWWVWRGQPPHRTGELVTIEYDPAWFRRSGSLNDLKAMAFAASKHPKGAY